MMQINSIESHPLNIQTTSVNILNNRTVTNDNNELPEEYELNSNNIPHKHDFQPNSVSFCHQFYAIFRRNFKIKIKNIFVNIFVCVMSFIFYFNIKFFEPERQIFPPVDYKTYVGSIDPDIGPLVKKFFDLNNSSNSFSSNITNKININDIISQISPNISNNINLKDITSKISPNITNMINIKNITSQIPANITNMINTKNITSQIPANIANMINIKNITSQISPNIIKNTLKKRRYVDQSSMTVEDMIKFKNKYNDTFNQYSSQYFTIFTNPWYIIADENIWKNYESQMNRLLDNINILLRHNLKRIYENCQEMPENFGPILYGLIGSFIKNYKIKFITNYKSYNDLNAYMLKHKNQTYTLVKIIKFNENYFDYSIGLTSSTLPKSNPNLMEKEICYRSIYDKDCQSMKFYTSGFIVMQSLIDNAFINVILENKSQPIYYPRIDLYLFPHKEFVLNKNMDKIALFIAFSMMSLIIVNSVELVTEREKKIKNIIIWMGLRRTVFWSAWIAVQSQLSFVISLIWIYINISGNYLPVEASLLGVSIFIFGLTGIILSSIMSIFFSEPKNASIFSIVFSFCFFGIPYVILTQTDVSLELINIFSFLPMFPFAASIQFAIENSEEITWKNMFKYPQEYSFGQAILVMSSYSIVYFITLILLDQWWSESSRNDKSKYLNEMKETMNSSSSNIKNNESINYETIRINGITKKFDDNLVLKGINLSLNENEITGIMGPNGAGKTTLISILIGDIEATSGHIMIYGLNQLNIQNRKMLRTKLGVCLQEDVFDEIFTAKENLTFFARMKGLNDREADEQVQEYLKITDLCSNSDVKSKDLSGGQKRKLCIAIALIGNSQIVFLDEPSSGVDPTSRQEIWKILKNLKQNRTIIITTQSMDEADRLCDKKAFIFDGKICCFGTSFALKTEYDVGYHVRVDLADNSNQNDKNIVLELLQSIFPQYTLERETKSELLLVIPSHHRTEYSNFFQELDNLIINKKCAIKSYGLTMTTLEDVFLKLSQNTKTNTYCEVPNIDLDKYHYKRNVMDRFRAFFKIRYLLITRNYHLLFQILFYLLLFFIVQIFVVKFITISSDPVTSFKMNDPKMLAINDYNVSSNIEPKVKSLLEYYKKYFKNQSKIIKNSDKNMINNYKYAINYTKSDVIDFIADIHDIKTYPTMMNTLSNVILLQNNMSMVHINTGSSPTKFIENELIIVIFFIVLISQIQVIIPSLLACEVVEDNEHGIKAFLLDYGLGRLEYWLVLYLSQTLILISVNLIVIIFVIIQTPNDSSVYSYPAFIAFLIVFILNTICSPILIYPFTFFFQKRESAHAVLSQITVIPTIVLIGIILVTFDNLLTVKIIIFLWPFCAPEIGMFSIYMDAQRSKFFDNFSYFESGGITITVIYSILLNTIIRLIILLPLDVLYSKYGDFSTLFISIFKPRSKIEENINENEDSDVTRERELICRNSGPYKSLKSSFLSILTIKNLKKIFDKKVVVNNISFRVSRGQIFGLLGSNGAGKTTIMRMLIGEIIPTSGEMYVQDKNLKNISRYEVLSYCPQNNPLFKQITMKEHFELFSSIRGVDKKQKESLIDDLTKSMQITEHAHKTIKTLSGGTKRKVCLLVSILGNSKLTLLDEPSTGLDPQAKRHMWNLIIKHFGVGEEKSTILTTHSMEEVEALCTRTGIMKKGTLKCLGTIQHLKTKYGKGFMAEIKTYPTSKSKLEKIKNKFLNCFPEANVKIDKINDQIIVEIINLKSVTALFRELERLQLEYSQDIQNYGIFQSSIEKIFIDLTSN